MVEALHGKYSGTFWTIGTDNDLPSSSFEKAGQQQLGHLAGDDVGGWELFSYQNLQSNPQAKKIIQELRYRRQEKAVDTFRSMISERENFVPLTGNTVLLDNVAEGSIGIRTLGQSQVYEFAPRLSEIMSENLLQLLEEFREENWDNEGALAFGDDTLRLAQQIVGEFPSDINEPDVSVTPHGELDFDWTLSSSKMVTVSACPTGEIAFAAMIDDTRARGREMWSGHLPLVLGACFSLLRRTWNQTTV